MGKSHQWEQRFPFHRLNNKRLYQIDLLAKLTSENLLVKRLGQFFFLSFLSFFSIHFQVGVGVGMKEKKQKWQLIFLLVKSTSWFILFCPFVLVYVGVIVGITQKNEWKTISGPDWTMLDRAILLVIYMCVWPKLRSHNS